MVRESVNAAVRLVAWSIGIAIAVTAILIPCVLLVVGLREVFP